MASYKDYKSISAAQKAGSLYYMNKQGKKMLAVTKEQLDAWKKKNKGKYKGSALTAWANNKGKNISGAPTSSKIPKARPGSAKDVITVEKLPPAFTIPTKGKEPKQSIGEREAKSKQVDKVKKVAEEGLAKATKFDEWYKKNKDKYKNRARAMEAYKMGPGRTESTRYGNSKGSLQKKKKGYAKGGMTDYRKKGMFYGGGMARPSKKS
tara:strand:+ start:168 stop:791 length:624 start_codon:yes stop_codon:yes gene_type:complete